jgi:hypothetical protein
LQSTAMHECLYQDTPASSLAPFIMQLLNSAYQFIQLCTAVGAKRWFET